MVQRPLFEEEDIVSFTEDGITKHYFVLQTEDVQYDYRGFGIVAPKTLTSYVQITDLEPSEVEEPEYAMYQVRAGIDVGLAYVEILAGAARRGTYKVPRPSSSNYFVGYISPLQSPPENPTFEFYLTYNQIPAFAVYNPYNRPITPHLTFTGRKCRLIKMAETSPEGNKTLVVSSGAAYIPYSINTIQSWVKQLEAGTKKHRTISLVGLQPRR